MQDVYLFVKKDYYYNLGFNKEGEELYNLPQYNTDITLYKGIENKIRFSLRDRDRRGISLRDREIFITLINPKLNLKLVKKLFCKDSYKGLYDVTFTEKELRDFEPTYYQASVTCKDLEGNEDILYTGVEWHPIFNINIKEGLRDVYKPAISVNCDNMLHNFYHNKENGLRVDYFVSEKIKADDNDSQTASITVEDYIGKVIMEGTTEINPSDTEWFKIDCKHFDEKTTETFCFNKMVNCHWIRFKYEPKVINQGKIKEILYRN